MVTEQGVIKSRAKHTVAQLPKQTINKSLVIVQSDNIQESNGVSPREPGNHRYLAFTLLLVPPNLI